MTTERMIERKHELGYTNEMISERSGVPLSTVQKIFSGTTITPRYDTMMALERILAGPEDLSQRGCFVSEVLTKYVVKQPGEYTLEDYLKLPDDQRVELIDGVFYDMAAPNNAHQIMALGIVQTLSSFIRENNGDCIPMIAPADVQLDCDDKTIVQPDVFVVCDRSKFTLARTVGAPDLVIEILSPASRKKDMILKLSKYENAGVREYWMIDPVRKYIIVYNFERNDYPDLYTFSDIVPVAIFGGACKVDFSALYESIRFLYE